MDEKARDFTFPKLPDLCGSLWADLGTGWKKKEKEAIIRRLTGGGDWSHKVTHLVQASIATHDKSSAETLELESLHGQVRRGSGANPDHTRRRRGGVCQRADHVEHLLM